MICLSNGLYLKILIGKLLQNSFAYTSDKQCKMIYKDGVNNKLSTEDIIKLFATSYPQTFDYIRCIYSVADDTNTLYEWYFDIDTTKIRTVMDRKELTPGTFIATNDWDYQSKNYISLTMVNSNQTYIIW